MKQKILTQLLQAVAEVLDRVETRPIAETVVVLRPVRLHEAAEDGLQIVVRLVLDSGQQIVAAEDCRPSVIHVRNAIGAICASLAKQLEN